jgi:hypothetical protein
MDAFTADLLSRVHEDLLALLGLLESGRRSSNAGGQGTPGDDHPPHGVGDPGCRVLPGEI